jgi:hypothetical protein
VNQLIPLKGVVLFCLGFSAVNGIPPEDSCPLIVDFKNDTP